MKTRKLFFFLIATKGITVFFLLLNILPGCKKDQDPAGTSSMAPYVQTGGTISKTGQSYSSSAIDQSGVSVTNSGILNLSKSKVITIGNTSSPENSSYYGLNAGVLATMGSTINLTGNSIITSGSGGNGVFAYGTSTITLNGDTVKCSGRYAHALMAAGGGTLTATDITLNTAGANSGAISTDRGSGTITIDRAKVTTSGEDAPGIYSTGVITVSNSSISASGSEAAVIEGANSIALINTSLSSGKEGKWGVLIMQSTAATNTGIKGNFTMSGGSATYTATNGPLFYITNSKGIITLNNVKVTTTSGTLLKAAAGTWGTAGSNGGTAWLTCSAQTLAGNIVADNYSSVSLTLQNGSKLTGSINTANSASSADLTLDANSSWTLTANSYLTTLNIAGGISGSSITNIIGNGFNAYYKSSANNELGGRTYTISGGGFLIPL